MISIRVSAAAQDDIRTIRIYSKRTFGVPVAKDYMAGLRRTFGFLRENPLAGALSEELTGDIRTFTYRSHRLFYCVADEHIEIVRILHHARDVARALGR
ncbi:MAG: type II toxin-antitoxin system RelE/ParE family toxin [Sphingomonadales bacterium]